MDPQYRWLADGYDLEIGHFQKWLAWWLPGVQCLLAQWYVCIYYKHLDQLLNIEIERKLLSEIFSTYNFTL